MMYWQRLTPSQRRLTLGVAAAGIAIIGVAGYLAPANDGATAVEAAAAAAPAEGQRAAPAASRLRFTRWQHPSGLFSAEVPEGWVVDGAIGDATEQGPFRLNATSQDGRSVISLGHNWVSYMEFQYGPYQPGAATIERFLLPDFIRQQGYTASRIVYRTPNRRVSMPSEIGVPIPFDSGTIGFLLSARDGGYAAGTAMGETMYIQSPGTPGLWRLRLFATAVAPATAPAQADARAALDRAAGTLDLSPQFFALWNQAFAHTQQQMRDYSRQMDQVFSRYLQSASRSTSGGRRDSAEDWAGMMRGGQYAENTETGERYWVTNDSANWWVSDSGTVVGNNTGAPPAVNENWRPLVMRGQ
ncbi:MAG: hypothetical protein AB7P34_13540 [Vicinamibacterales bacterium]